MREMASASCRGTPCYYAIHIRGDMGVVLRDMRVDAVESDGLRTM